MLKVYAIILNYNSNSTLLECIDSVFHSQNVDFHVVVVDNNSTDGSLEMARTKFPRVEYIKNNRNIGFAAGNNVGIRFALERDADYIVLINSDAVIQPETIHTLIHTAEKLPKPSIISPQILKPSGEIWYNGAQINWLGMSITHNKRPIQKFQKTDVATGCVFSVHKDVFKEIGLLNESYFLYYEDADFSYCASKAGFIIGIEPSASTIHYEVSENTDKKPLKTYWLVLSALLFFTAHASVFYKVLYKLIIPLRKLKNTIIPREISLKKHISRAYKDFKQAKKHYVSHR